MLALLLSGCSLGLSDIHDLLPGVGPQTTPGLDTGLSVNPVDSDPTVETGTPDTGTRDTSWTDTGSPDTGTGPDPVEDLEDEVDYGSGGGPDETDDTICDQAWTTWSTSLSVSVKVPIHGIYMADDDGNNQAADDDDLQDAIDDANDWFEPMGITFYLRSSEVIEDSDLLNTNRSEWESLRDSLDRDGPVYVLVADELTGSSGGSVGGIAAFPSRQVGHSFIITAGNLTHSTSTTFEHELGHVFALHHTHTVINGTESADGSDCADDGDEICDTNADPGRYRSSSNPDGCHVSNCQLDSCESTDENGDDWNPPIDNVMSYYDDACQTGSFTPQQQATIVCALNEMMTLDTVAETEICDNGADDDADGLFDCEDPDCDADPACAECGDGTVNTSDEECDGNDLQGHACVTLGYDGGSLSCDSDCTFDESDCELWTCGDGVLQTGEDCDGNAFGGETCTTQGYDGGQLLCDSTCSFDIGSCTTTTAEVCTDGTDNDGDGDIDCHDSDCQGQNACAPTITSVTCDTYDRGESATCEMKGTNLVSTQHVWVGCMSNLSATWNSDTSLTLTGDWQCACATGAQDTAYRHPNNSTNATCTSNTKACLTMSNPMVMGDVRIDSLSPSSGAVNDSLNFTAQGCNLSSSTGTCKVHIDDVSLGTPTCGSTQVTFSGTVGSWATSGLKEVVIARGSNLTCSDSGKDCQDLFTVQ